MHTHPETNRALLRRIGLLLALLLLFSSACPGSAAQDTESSVTVLSTPNGGIQPQAAVDDQGALHLVYYQGDSAAGDLFYVRQARAGRGEFSPPVRVNTRPGGAMAKGTIRGAQVALGPRGRIHVVWNGSKSSGTHPGVPLWYTRLDATGAFEPERDMITKASGLDGGSSVAADALGRVYVVWHAGRPGEPEDEIHRAVFVARSTDEGKSFAAETPALTEATGACACCGLRAFATRSGDVFIAFRAAREKLQRDALLLVSRDRGDSFQVIQSHPWQVSTCPMSSFWLSPCGEGAVAAWETGERVYGMRLDSVRQPGGNRWKLPGERNCKHPVAVCNRNGETLFAWTEGTGWERGGVLAWAILDAGGQVRESGRGDTVPVWSLVAAVENPNGGFLLFH